MLLSWGKAQGIYITNELLERIASATEKVKRAEAKYYNEIGSDGENKAHQDLSANTQALNTAVREWVTGIL